jgi:hypothetical protein
LAARRSAPAPQPSLLLPSTTRYCGYLIRCSVDGFTVMLAGDEVMYQAYPRASESLGAEAIGPWMLEQAKAFVDARRAGHV